MEQAPNALTKGSVVKALVTFTLPFSPLLTVMP